MNHFGIRGVYLNFHYKVDGAKLTEELNFHQKIKELVIKYSVHFQLLEK